MSYRSPAEPAIDGLHHSITLVVRYHADGICTRDEAVNQIADWTMQERQIDAAIYTPRR